MNDTFAPAGSHFCPIGMTLLPQRDAGLALGCVKYLRLSGFPYFDIVASWLEVIRARLCDGFTLTRHYVIQLKWFQLVICRNDKQWWNSKKHYGLRLKHPGVMSISLGRFKRMFSDVFEKELVDYTNAMQNCFCGLTIKWSAITGFPVCNEQQYWLSFFRRTKTGRHWLVMVVYEKKSTDFVLPWTDKHVMSNRFLSSSGLPLL